MVPDLQQHKDFKKCSKLHISICFILFISLWQLELEPQGPGLWGVEEGRGDVCGDGVGWLSLE